MFCEYLDIDCARLALSFTNLFELFYAHLIPISIGIIPIVAAGGVLYYMKSSIWTVTQPILAWVSRPFVKLGQRLHDLQYYKGQRMSKPDEGQSDRGMEAFTEWVEGEVTSGKMTRYQADGWYAKMCRHWPVLRYCIQGPLMQPKERMRENQINRARDSKGAVIPAPIPGGATRKKHSVVKV